jgi:hypothetical protein
MELVFEEFPKVLVSKKIPKCFFSEIPYVFLLKTSFKECVGIP